MKKFQRVGAAIALAALFSSAMLVAPRGVAAAPPKKGGDANAATCAYLASVIAYPYVSPIIKVWAISLYNSYGCGQ